MNQAAQDFFASLPKESETEPEFNIMEEPEKRTPEPEQKEPEHIEKEEEERKKPLRSERRAEKQNEFMQQKWQEEREARIRLEEQVKALAEGRKVEVDPNIKKILLGEVKDPDEAALMFDAILSNATQRAEERAIAKYQQLQSQGDEEVNKIQSSIETSLEAIEDRYGVDLTDDTETRNAFLDFVESIAPEDSDELPNMRAAWQLFQNTRKAPAASSERKSQISSRSMIRSSQNRPEGKDIKPVTFDEINRGNWWERHISGR